MSIEISIDILQTDVKLISMKSFTDVLMAKANIIDIFKWTEKNVDGNFHRHFANAKYHWKVPPTFCWKKHNDTIMPLEISPYSNFKNIIKTVICGHVGERRPIVTDWPWLSDITFLRKIKNTDFIIPQNAPIVTSGVNKLTRIPCLIFAAFWRFSLQNQDHVDSHCSSFWSSCHSIDYLTDNASNLEDSYFVSTSFQLLLKRLTL